jgi:hypothetical protein
MWEVGKVSTINPITADADEERIEEEVGEGKKE